MDDGLRIKYVGDVDTSAAYMNAEDLADQEIRGSMVGIILAINPSDDENNLSASVEETQKGWRHECTVLITDANTESNLLLENVIIPPQAMSGIDDFSEELPRSLYRSIDGAKVAENFNKQDLTKLDACWCVVQFIGGSIDKPYIANWWHHPGNFHDPGSSGKAYGGSALQQVGVKNRNRLFRRVNGTQLLVSPTGDIYVDTSEANSKVEVLPTVKRLGKRTGGSIQVDIKSTQQLEFNWNAPVEGLKAGSTSASQSREQARPHLKVKKPTGDPSARETSRTLIRGTEQSLLLSTSSLNINCQNENDTSGDCVLTAEDQILLSQSAPGDTAAVLNISDGNVTVQSDDGSAVSIGEDQVVLINSSASMVSLKSGVITISAPGGVVVSPPVSLGGTTGGTTEGALKGGTFTTTYTPFIEAFSASIAGLAAKYATGAPPAPSDLATLVSAIATSLAAHAGSSSTWVSDQVKLA